MGKGICCMLLNSVEFCRVLLGSVVFCWVLLDSVGFCSILLGSVGFCWVLLDSIGFCWILMGCSLDGSGRSWVDLDKRGRIRTDASGAGQKHLMHKHLMHKHLMLTTIQCLQAPGAYKHLMPTSI